MATEVTEKIYEVLPGKKYTGKHGVYVGKNDEVGKIVSDKFKESELMGSLDMALNGSDKHKIKPTIKLFTPSKAKK